MNEKTIRKLKNKFVLVASLSFLVVMIFISGFIFLFNRLVTQSEASETLDLILENDGILSPQMKIDSAAGKTEAEAAAPEASSESETEAFEAAKTESSADAATEATETSAEAETEVLQQFYETDRGTGSVVENMFYLGSSFFSAEFTYSTRYFAAVYNADGSVKDVKIGHIASVDRGEAEKLTRLVLEGRKSFGRFGNYYYKKLIKEDGTTIVAFLDCTERIKAGKRLFNFMLILIGFGMLLAIALMRALSGRVVQSEVRNMENQKSFITDASHELKTPLAVIKANTEITELTSGETEWTQSTLRQVDRMTGLIQNLVMITRAQEQDAKRDYVSVDASRAVKETADTFEAVAVQDGKKIEQEIPEGITKLGEEGDIRQLTSLLVDNAIKYCDDKGTVRISLTKKGRNGIRLVVSNNYAAGKNVDYTRFFERFYREDKSHNQDKGGYGIGLSIAENICEKYRGEIRATWADGVISFICILN